MEPVKNQLNNEINMGFSCSIYLNETEMRDFEVNYLNKNDSSRLKLPVFYDNLFSKNVIQKKKYVHFFEENTVVLINRVM